MEKVRTFLLFIIAASSVILVIQMGLFLRVTTPEIWDATYSLKLMSEPIRQMKAMRDLDEATDKIGKEREEHEKPVK